MEYDLLYRSEVSSIYSSRGLFSASATVLNGRVQVLELAVFVLSVKGAFEKSGSLLKFVIIFLVKRDFIL